MLAHRSKQNVVVEKDIMVRMSDGTNLATDIYLPSDRTGPVPLIMERTPYDKAGASRSELLPGRTSPLTRTEVATFFAQQGYGVVMQDCRGRYGSEGEFVKYLYEAGDGQDTMHWLLEQAWCNGRVGTMGLSYGAHTQLALACMNPPGLACMFMDSGGFSSAYHAGIRRGGAFELKQATWACRHALLSKQTLQSPQRRKTLMAQDIPAWFRDMPWSPGHSPLSAAPEFESYLFKQWQAGIFDDYWKQTGLYAEGYYDRIPDIPVSIVGSWYDPYALACTINFVNLQGREADVRLLMGPWTHGNRSASYAGDVDFGEQATLESYINVNYLEYRLEWFNHFLQNEGGMAGPQAGLHYFRMGGGTGARNEEGRLQHGGQWLHAETWPPAGVVTKQLHLHVNGVLNDMTPLQESASLAYVSDPDDPVPTIGGAVTSGDPVMEGGAYDQRVTEETFCYSDHARNGPLSERDDVLVFETAPLEADLELTGQISAELWVSSDCPDTDFCIKLIDVYPPSEDYPDGFAMNISEGILRARYREGWEREVMMSAGEVYRIEVETFPTSNLFKKGHRLRLDVSSSNYPQFDINPNSGAEMGFAGPSRVANNRIFCSVDHPSRIMLSIVP
ncbi:MAG: putative CocE/NonD family hydrolase [Lysobacterales bacterium]|jgi:putative CocE/NonD family hydrolase